MQRRFKSPGSATLPNKVSQYSRGPTEPTQPRLNARTALLGLFVALTIVLASTTVYESGIRTTLTSTSTSTSTLTETTTVATSPPASTTRLTTSTLFSSVFGTPAALVVNSSDGLGLSLQVEPSPDGNYTITVRESNLLDSVNNVTAAEEWKLPQQSLDPCGTPSPPATVELALVQGLYAQSNYTSAKALPLYDTANLYTCGRITFEGGSNEFAFQPLNDHFAFPSGSAQPDDGTAQASITTGGYWTGGQDDVPAAFQPFPAGFYTAIGADEWGNVVFLQFCANCLGP